MQIRLRSGILILIITITCVLGANAQDCFAPSPTAQGESKYPPIIPRELTKTEHGDLNRLFKSIVGNWSGTGKEVLCKGRVANPTQEIVRYTIKNGKSVFDRFGNFSLKLELHSAEKRSSHSEKQDLFLTEKYFRADSSNSSGDVELLEVSANLLRYRKRAAIGGSYPFGTSSQGEAFTTISRVNNTIVLSRSYYFQGRHSGAKEWRLSK
jgi:hypothetical protein